MDAKRICSASFVLIIVFWETLLDAEFVRLVDGRTDAEGRIEVFHDNEWGTVCRHYFDDKGATVVCSMLGLPSSGAHPTVSFGPGNGTIWLDNVACIGNETSLKSCTLLEWGVHNCGHRDDVGVQCVEAMSVRFRLVDGSSPFDGIVELNVNNTWGTTCYYGNYDIRILTVIYRILGVENLKSAFAMQHSVVHGHGVEPAKFGSWGCHGTETSIDKCYHSGLFTNSCGTDSTRSKVLRVFCVLECPPIRNCKIAGQTCNEENRTVCSECEDNFQLTADHQQCELKHNLCLEFPVFISGWACASVFLIVLIITYVVLRIGRIHIDKEKTDNSPSELIIYQNQNTTETPMTTCQSYEIPFTTEQSALQQDDIYDVPDVMYEELQN